MTDHVPAIMLGGSHHLREITLASDRKCWDFPKKVRREVSFHINAGLAVDKMVAIERYRLQTLIIACQNRRVVLIDKHQEFPTFHFHLERECLVLEGLTDEQAEDLFFLTFHGPGF